MCRFVAFRGEKPLQLKKVLNETPNSLINQSRLARETRTGLNADGFGVGWYNHDISDEPAIFKSIQPAWNDSNLMSISSKVASDCFIGHVRASTIGDVSLANCHPFSYQELLFAHNGTINNFTKIRRDLLDIIGDNFFDLIKGQTDSEHFFYLMCSFIEKKYPEKNLESMVYGCIEALEQVNLLLKRKDIELAYRMNSVFTNGRDLLAVRLSFDKNKPAHSLYYSLANIRGVKGMIIASERLDEYQEEWVEVPENHLLLIGSDFKASLHPLSSKPESI